MKFATPCISSGIKTLIVVPLLAFLVTACSEDNAPTNPGASKNASEYDATVATSWFNLQLELVQKTGGFTPTVASRSFGYTGVTLYQAILPGMPNNNTLEGQLNGLATGSLPTVEEGKEYHWPTVANAALARINSLLFASAADSIKAKITTLEAQYANPSGVDAEVVTRSTAYGQAVADAIFEWSKTDGGHEANVPAKIFPADYVPPTGAGLWVPTPRKLNQPAQKAMHPYWGQNRPFVLTQGNPNNMTEPGPPPAYSDNPSSPFYMEAQEVYDAVTNLTTEQRSIATFWSDDPGATCTPSGHSVSIATQCLKMESKKLDAAAGCYAKVGIAVADAFIACWETKFKYNLIRPLSIIMSTISPTFTADSLPLNTPPFPEYTSGHSTQSGAAAEILTSEMGASFAFTDNTHSARCLPSRQFSSFFAFAEEAAMSRLYGGIHYRSAIEKGLEQGKKIGQQVLTRIDWTK